jgi:hypothetical protein
MLKTLGKPTTIASTVLVLIDKIRLMGAVKKHRRPRSPAGALASLGFTASERASVLKEVVTLAIANICSSLFSTRHIAVKEEPVDDAPPSAGRPPPAGALLLAHTLSQQQGPVEIEPSDNEPEAVCCRLGYPRIRPSSSSAAAAFPNTNQAPRNDEGEIPTQERW